MPAPITITRPTFSQVDSLSHTAFNGVAIVGAQVPDALAGAEGVIRLAGDLAGTAAAPVIGNLKITTAKLDNESVTTDKLAANAVTFEKLQEFASGHLLGRATEDAGPIELIPCTAAGRALLAAANAEAQRTALGLEIGEDVMPFDADLEAIAELETLAFGRGFLVLADVAAARTKLELGNAAPKNVGNAAGTVCAGDDARLSDARQCNNTFSDAAASRTALGIGSMAQRNVTISTDAPSGGADGDIWFRYTA